MRKNLPVTGEERLLDPKRPIVTKTDLKGVIRYANPAFIDISGFSKEELLGKPHNVVRHPDMPPAAFEDMWQTIKAGLPWRGLVKTAARMARITGWRRMPRLCTRTASAPAICRCAMPRAVSRSTRRTGYMRR
jgi:PAS domain-containing protein